MARGATGALCLRLLLDEHFSPEIARQLRRLGHDVIAVKEHARLAGRADYVRVKRRDLRAPGKHSYSRVRPRGNEPLRSRPERDPRHRKGGGRPVRGARGSGESLGLASWQRWSSARLHGSEQVAGEQTRRPRGGFGTARRMAGARQVPSLAWVSHPTVGGGRGSVDRARACDKDGWG